MQTEGSLRTHTSMHARHRSVIVLPQRCMFRHFCTCTEPKTAANVCSKKLGRLADLHVVWESHYSFLSGELVLRQRQKAAIWTVYPEPRRSFTTCYALFIKPEHRSTFQALELFLHPMWHAIDVMLVLMQTFNRLPVLPWSARNDSAAELRPTAGDNGLWSNCSRGGDVV